MRTHRPVLLLPLLLAVVLLASCADEPDPGPSGPPPAAPTPERIPTDAPDAPLDRPTPVPDPLTSSPPPGASVVPADRVDASGLPPGFPTLAWVRDEATVGVYGRAGGCTEARVAVAEQNGDRVVVDVEQVTTSPGPCTRELLYPPLEATLDAPLGERSVVLRGAVR